MSAASGYFVDWATIERAGIKGPLVPGSHPWGAQG